MSNDNYFPQPEKFGGWRIADPTVIGVDDEKLDRAISYHNNEEIFTKKFGGALLIIYKGYIISENYITGTDGGPQPWKVDTCNDMKSSAKSVFGTAVGVFLEEYKNKVNLDTLLIGNSLEDSLIPQIWDHPITDERKKGIKIKHVLSMTSGHETAEPWLAPSPRHFYSNYSGSYQMYEYCFGWWYFEGIPAHRILRFEPGTGFNYSSFGLELLALAMRNISGELVGPYVYDRVLSKIGIPKGIRDNQFKDIPYRSEKKFNWSNSPGWGIGGSIGCNAYGADRSKSPYGYNTIVSSTFPCTARDYARIAYLWLNKGCWKNQQLVPKKWLEPATKRFKRDNGESPINYGLTFWTLDEVENVPKDTYMTRGNNLNDCYIVPSKDLIVVRQGNMNYEAKERYAFREKLIQEIVKAIP